MDPIEEYLNQQTVEVACPNCGNNVSVKISLAKVESHIACACGARLKTDQFVQTIKEAEALIKKTLRDPGIR